jgi:hypothetical protein
MLLICSVTICFADSEENAFSGSQGGLRYSYIKRIDTGISISNGAADVSVDIYHANGVTLNYAIMTIELVRSSTGQTIQSWSGTFYSDAGGDISFEDSQTLYATGGYYVRVSGTVYAVGGGHEPFYATSGTAYN